MDSTLKDDGLCKFKLIRIQTNFNQFCYCLESRLVLFSNRRLFCNPSFQMFFETSETFSSFSPNTLTCTTPISYQPSVENLIDKFQLRIFQQLFPEEFNKRNQLLLFIKECNEKIDEIDRLLKAKWEM